MSLVISWPEFRAIDLSGKTVIVTGGNRGIGLAISEQCAQAGADVAIIYRSHRDAETTAKRIAEQYNVSCKAYQCDVSSQKQVTDTVERIDREMGNIGGLVSNAGFSVHKPALDMTEEDYKNQFGTNFWGVFVCCQAVARIWKRKEHKKGRIVIISSMSSVIANRGVTQALYNPTKAAVDSLARSLAMEWAGLGILVNCVNPGYVDTEMNAILKTDKELAAVVNNAVMIGRISEPSEQAGPVVFLLSDFASYITGQQLVVDGGVTSW